jgi:DNA polymerase-1
MIDSIKAGWDIHSANAYNMYKKRDEKITFEAIEAAKQKKDGRKEALNDFEMMLLRLRDGAKTVGLGVMFGEGPTKMAHQLKLAGGRDEAMLLIQDFFATYPEIQSLIHFAHDHAHEHESMYTMLGRCRRFHRINNPYNTGVAAAEERQAFNHLIQGSEVEVMKLAMLQLHHNQDFQDCGGKLAGVVHDELLAFGPKENIVDILEIQKAIMGDPLRWGPIQLQLPVPVNPDGAHGTRWSAVH